MDQYLFGEGIVPPANGVTKRKRRAHHVRYLNNKKGSKSANIRGKRRKTGHNLGSQAVQHPQDDSQLPALPLRDGERDLTTLLEQSPPEEQKSSAEWSERQQIEEEHWQQKRSQLFGDFVGAHAASSEDISCSGCDGVASVMCDECPSTYFCCECDEKTHWLQPFHWRKHWVCGYFRGLPSSQTISTAGTMSSFSPVLPLQRSHHSCRSCEGVAMDIRPSSQPVIVITARGRFDIFLPEWSCSECGYNIGVTDDDMMKCGFFRASPVTRATVVHDDVFSMWESLKNHSPGTSLKAFLAMVQELGAKHSQFGPMDLEHMEKAYSEWSYMTYELDQLVASNYTVCEACGPKPMCVHVDGNFKLYRYRSAGDADTTKAYHAGNVIEDQGAVDAHVTKLANIAKTTNRCGVSTWAAARNNNGVPSKRTQDETGLSIATCRHSVILGALNMHRGELYAYSHLLHQNRFANLQFFASDIVCKYWPWSQRVAARFPEHATGETKPFLSVMHATGHAYYCQILYGGIWQQHSGWSVMETTEITNAHLSRAGNTTKHMTAAHRIDSLTDLAICYNKDKHQSMPKLLVKKMSDVKSRVPDLETNLQTLLRHHGLDMTDIPVLVSDLRSLAKFLSSRDVKSQGGGLESAIEMVSTSIRSHKSDLSRFGVSSKTRGKISSRLHRDTAKLRKLTERFTVQTGTVLTVTDVQEGCFPWHSVDAEPGSLTLSDKRAICDVYMRLSRHLEEIDILTNEAQQLLSTTAEVLAWLHETEKLVQEQLSMPGSERTAVVGEASTSGRYCINRESDDVLRGLVAVLRKAISHRQQQMEAARECFVGVF